MNPAVADSLKAAQDTIYVLQSTSPPWHQRPSFWISAAIAVFTGVYMVFTMRIFWKTEEQAEAAQESAEASRKAAEASQESLKEQKRLNDKQIEAIDQERIERAHPLLWLDIELTEEEDQDWIELEFINSSSLPAVDVEAVLLANYGPDYISVKEFNDALEVDMGNLDMIKFHLVTAIRKEVITANTSSTFKIKYPVLPLSLPTVLQYRDIHGQNYGRHFQMNSIVDTSKLEDRKPTPESIEQYSISEISPKKVKVTPRLFLIDSSSLKSEYDDPPRFMLVREEDKRGISIDNPITIWDNFENEPFLSNIAYFNSELRYAFRTGLFPYSFKIKDDKDGMTHFGILSQTTY